MSISAILGTSSSPYQLGATNNLFQKLSQDLKSGNLASAQKDFSALQQDIQNQGATMTKHFHQYRPLSTGSEDLTNQNSLLQELNQLGQNLTSGNLAGAQQAYAALQAQASVSTGGSLHQTSPPVFGPPVSTIRGAHHIEPPLLAPAISLVG